MQTDEQRGSCELSPGGIPMDGGGKRKGRMGPLACGCLTYLVYFQAFTNATPKFLLINMPCHYYPDRHLPMLLMSTIWQWRDLGTTHC
jgi:hypothetical protein